MLNIYMYMYVDFSNHFPWLQKQKEKEMKLYWTVLRNQLLSFYTSPAQQHSNVTPSLTIPVNQVTQELSTFVVFPRTAAL